MSAPTDCVHRLLLQRQSTCFTHYCTKSTTPSHTHTKHFPELLTLSFSCGARPLLLGWTQNNKMKLLNGMLLQLLTYQLFTSRSKVSTWGQVIIKGQWGIMRYKTNETFSNKARTVIPGCWLIWGSVFFSMAFIHVTLDTLMFMFCIDWWVWRLCDVLSVSAMRRRAVKHKHMCEMLFNPIFYIPVFAAV